MFNIQKTPLDNNDVIIIAMVRAIKRLKFVQAYYNI